jgi:GABA permease
VTMILLYLMTAAAQLKLRNQFERTAPERLQIRMWLHPFGSYIAIAAMLAILVFMGIDPNLSSQLWLSLLVAAGFAGAFFVFRRSKA